MSDDAIVMRHGSTFRLPAQCACCLAPATLDSVHWVQLGGGLRREFRLPECAVCRKRKTSGLVLGTIAVFGSGALGLAIGAMVFPMGFMRIVSMLVVLVLGIAAFVVLRKVTHPKGHAPSCDPIARYVIDRPGGATGDAVIHFARPEFARVWRDINPDSVLR